MRGGSVKSTKVPEDAPDETNAASRVEHCPPSKVGDDKCAQRVGQADADAEP